MNDDEKFSEDEKFSNDPEEDLRMENDFLKLKMMAESGAVFGGDKSISSDIENEFLKRVMAFEKAYAEAKPLTMREILKNPDFAIEENLKDEKFVTEFERLLQLLKSNQINVNFIKERSDRFKYHFITTELFDHETTFAPHGDMVGNFIYEEFHPDHHHDITEITHEFLNDFINRKLTNNTNYISESIIEPDGTILSRKDLISRFFALYEATDALENFIYNIEEVSFEPEEPVEGIRAQMGFSEGSIRYDIAFKDGSRKNINGPFKIYFTREIDSWQICFFYLAGYNLHKNES